MSRTFEGIITNIGNKTDYNYDFLVAMHNLYNEVVSVDEDTTVESIDGFADAICKKIGYDWDFLVDRYNEVMEEDGDVDYFLAVTMQHDW